jgi:predicted ester cyclase
VATRGREDSAAGLRLFFTAFPDYGVETEAVVSGADGAAWWGQVSMTFGGPLLGRAPTGRRARLPGFSAFEFRDGMISRERFYFDLGTLCREIGLPQADFEAALAGLRAAAA